MGREVVGELTGLRLVKSFLCFQIALFFILLWPFTSLAVTAIEQSRRLQLVYSHLLDFRSNAAPIYETSGTLEVSVDLQPMPDIDARIGAKTEPVETLPVSGQLRLRGFLFDGWMLGISSVPGLTIGKQKATALQTEMGLRKTWGSIQTGLRVSQSLWKIVGQMTTTRYKDRLENRQQNIDFSLGLDWSFWQPYAGIGRGILNSDFWIEESQITLKIENHVYSYQFVGLGLMENTWSFNFEQHRTEDFLLHFQLSATRKF